MKLSPPQWISAVMTVLLLVPALWDLTHERTGYYLFLPILAVLYFLPLVASATLKCISSRYNLYYDVYQQLTLALWWFFTGFSNTLFGGITMNPILGLVGPILCGFSLVFVIKATQMTVRRYRRQQRKLAKAAALISSQARHH